jgi:hypothetical protein
MNDALMQTLLDRQVSAASQPSVLGAASQWGSPEREPHFETPPPNPKPHLPPAWKRWETAEKMKAGYANGWSPNPLITRVTRS